MTPKEWKDTTYRVWVELKAVPPEQQHLALEKLELALRTAYSRGEQDKQNRIADAMYPRRGP